MDRKYEMIPERALRSFGTITKGEQYEKIVNYVNSLGL